MTRIPAAAVALLLLHAAGPVAADRPLETITLPKGFSIALYAEVPNARSMALGGEGVVFVGNREGNSVYAVIDHQHSFHGDDVVKVASGLNSPNGVAFKDGALYVAEPSRILRFDGALDFARKPAAARTPLKPIVVSTRLPPDRGHGWKYLALGPDGLLYFQIGAPCNICDPGDPYASIARMKTDGTAFEIIARGVRNSVGMTWHPDTKELWFKQIFIAEHGSWNRSTPIGYRVSLVRLDGNRPVKYEPFAEGWLQGSRAWGRPVDVLELPDGSLLVSDDTANALYRISYRS